MAFPLAVPAGLVAIRIVGQGIKHLTKKQAAKAIKEGWGSTVKTKKPYSQIRKERLSQVKAERKAQASKEKATQQEHGRHIREGTDYATKQKRAWRNLTPAQRKEAGQSLANLEKNIAESTKAVKPPTVSGGQKGMRLPRKGETPLRKRGGVVKRKRGKSISRRGGGKIMQGYKAGGKVQVNNMKLNGFESIESLEDTIKRLKKLLETSKVTPKIKKERGGGKIMYGYKAGGKV